MGKREKPAGKKPIEMTTEELAERLFSPELKHQLDDIAHEKDDKPKPSNSSQG